MIETASSVFRVSVATLDEAPAVLRLRDELAEWMVQQGIEQWQPGEMPLPWLESCIAHGWIYTVWFKEPLTASVTVASQDPFVWEETDDRAGYIHTLMVDRAYAGHGIGRSLLGWAESHITTSGRELARLDCTTSNGRLCRYYEEAGYRAVGQRTFRLKDHEIFPNVQRLVDTVLYEKPLARSRRSAPRPR